MFYQLHELFLSVSSRSSVAKKCGWGQSSLVHLTNLLPPFGERTKLVLIRIYLDSCF